MMFIVLGHRFQQSAALKLSLILPIGVEACPNRLSNNRSVPIRTYRKSITYTVRSKALL